MSESNIKFTSNIEPVKGDIRFDSVFQSKIHDFKSLEDMYKLRYSFTFEQQKEFNSCSVPCGLALEKNDYVFGLTIGPDNKEKLICQCINADCKNFADCREDNSFDEMELLPWLENDEYKDLLEYADEIIAKMEETPKRYSEEDLHVEITDDGIVITAEEKQIDEKKPLDPYSSIDPVIRLADGTDISSFIHKNLLSDETGRRTPLAEQWTTIPVKRMNSMNLCTSQTMRAIKALEAEENKKRFHETVDPKEEIAWAQGNGKHTASGYDFIVESYQKNAAAKERQIINHEYSELAKRLKVQSRPLSMGTTSYGTKVSIRDITNQNVYSYILLGKEDARFLKNHRIIPYESELGSALYGLRLGQQIELSFFPGEDFHICEVISIETSDYLY